MQINRMRFLSMVAASVLGVSGEDTQEQGLRGPYIDSLYLTKIPFGTTSPYIQPWRAYQETIPATRLLNGIGTALNLDQEAPDPVCHMLSDCGIRHARIEINWGDNLSEDETTVRKDRVARYRSHLQACKKYGLRPLILLNANHGYPCPMQEFQRTLAGPAHKGERSVILTDTSGLKPGYSGFNHLATGKACEVLITKIVGDGKVLLSRPLSKDLGASGTKVDMATLRYQPFGKPTSPEYRATREGWKRYVLAVARFVSETLSPDGSSERGFDMEIWNELSFGSDFLYLSRYYDPSPYPGNDAILTDLVRATVEVANAYPDVFSGVQLCDGLSNTIPWTASQAEPPRISALSKHPYPIQRKYHGKPEQAFPIVNARLKAEDKDSWYPTYTARFPEYYANALQTETVIRDLSPISTPIGSAKHGRYARVDAEGKVQPCAVWFTEWGMAPNEFGITDAEKASTLKARLYARALCLFINKGVQRLYFYGARGGDTSLGILSDHFLAALNPVRAESVIDPAIATDASYRSPLLAMLRRLIAVFTDSADVDLRETRPLTVEDIRDRHHHFQWQGDGTPEHPALYNRECFAFLPFQANDTRFVIPYYIQTRDITVPLGIERYTVILSGFRNVQKVKIQRLYDPVTGSDVPEARILKRESNGRVSLSLPATDYPYLLVLDDAG